MLSGEVSIIRQGPEFFYRKPTELTQDALAFLSTLPDLTREPLSIDPSFPFEPSRALLCSAEKLLLILLAGKEPTTRSGLRTAIDGISDDTTQLGDAENDLYLRDLIKEIVASEDEAEGDDPSSYASFTTRADEDKETIYFVGKKPLKGRGFITPKIFRLSNDVIPNGNILALALAASEARYRIRNHFGISMDEICGRLTRLKVLEHIFQGTNNETSTYPVREIFPTSGFSGDILRDLEGLFRVRVHPHHLEYQMQADSNVDEADPNAGPNHDTESPLITYIPEQEYQLQPSERALREYEMFQDLGFYDPENTTKRDTTVVFAKPIIDEGGRLNKRRLMINILSAYSSREGCSVELDVIVRDFLSSLERFQGEEPMDPQSVRELIYKTCSRNPGFRNIDPFELVATNGRYTQIRMGSKLFVCNNASEAIVQGYRDLQPQDELSVSIEWRKRVIEEWLSSQGECWIGSARAREIYRGIIEERGMGPVSKNKESMTVEGLTRMMTKREAQPPTLIITPQQRFIVQNILSTIAGTELRYQDLIVSEPGKGQMETLFGKDVDESGDRRMELHPDRVKIIRFLIKEVANNLQRPKNK